MNDNYTLMTVRNELKKCRNCNVNSPCCSIDCEIFDQAVEAKEAGLLELEADICKGCAEYNVSCPGYENKGYPHPPKESHTIIKSTCNSENSDKVITCNFKQSQNYNADEKC